MFIKKHSHNIDKSIFDLCTFLIIHFIIYIEVVIYLIRTYCFSAFKTIMTSL